MGCVASKPDGDASPKPRKRGNARTRDGGAPATRETMPSVPPVKLKRAERDPMERYDDLESLGAGGFSVVRKVRHRQSAKTYAMKIISVKEGDADADAAPGDKDEHGKERMSVNEVTSEIDILRVLTSPTMLRLEECHWYGDKVYVVTEVLHGGAVLDAILRMKSERYTEAEAKVVVQRTVQGIDYMHKNFVLHRDLKLENLLLRSNDDLASVVIADFGLARRCQNREGVGSLPHSRGIDTAPVGTPVFAAPEVVEQKSYGGAIDMWSLGVITYVLLTGAMPRSLWKSALKYGRVVQRDFGFDCFEWDSVSETAREFVMSCLAHKPVHRLTPANCLKHPWLQQVESVRPAPLRIKSKLRDFAKGMKLPLRKYEAGDILIHQGARATDEVFLIKSGSVKIVVSPVDADRNILRDQGAQVAKREPGEFIGEMALGDQLIAKSKSASSSRAMIDKRIAEVLAKGPPKRKKGEKFTLKSWVSARMVAKKWIGGRRNADVIAQTEVQCLVMGRREMAWAIASDPDVGSELQKSMRQRRHELASATRKD